MEDYVIIDLIPLPAELDRIADKQELEDDENFDDIDDQTEQEDADTDTDTDRDE
jgi:hypothetical protein